MKDMRKHGVDVLTLGQYLRPTTHHLAVVEYVKPEQFDWYRRYEEAPAVSSYVLDCSDRFTSYYLLTTERPKHSGSLMWLAALWCDPHTRSEAHVCDPPLKYFDLIKTQSQRLGSTFLHQRWEREEILLLLEREERDMRGLCSVFPLLFCLASQKAGCFLVLLHVDVVLLLLANRMKY